ncbi:MAG: cation diffusion facilitator family transporter [Coriobacteriia bacterium]|nr:cation diffusion facilitator family transporter [Coriobacteriia bacterium]
MVVREQDTSRAREVRRVLLVVMTLNLVVSVAKIVIGVLTGTNSVRGDGIHSIFDSLGNLAGIIGISLAARPADESHPYGHGKFETAASLVIGVMLLIAAFEVGSGAVNTLVTGEYGAQPSALALGIMVVTLVVNITLTTYEQRAGRRLNSSVLGADSKHTLSDALVTISVIVGLIFVNLGFPIADPIATLIVTVAIVATAVDVFKDVLHTFSDAVRIDPQEIERSVMEVPGVMAVHRVRTRGLENEVYADLHVLVDPAMTIQRAHEISDEVERKLAASYPQLSEVVVHLEPATAEELREA